MKNKTYKYLDDYDVMDHYSFNNEEDDQSNELVVEKRKYQNLWKAVISQAVTDSVNNYKRTENKLEKVKALNWLKNSSDDFVFVCDLAGYNSKYVRSKTEYFFSKLKLIKLS